MVIFHSYVTVFQRVTWDNHLAVMAEKSHLLYGFTALPSAWPEKNTSPLMATETEETAWVTQGLPRSG